MHECLIIDEILRFIMLSCEKASLLALACTCRTFTEAALDSLWYDQKSLTLLLKCLPADAWQEIVEPESEDESDVDDEPVGHWDLGETRTSRLVLSRELLAEEWVRFESYACRIRVLNCQAATRTLRYPKYPSDTVTYKRHRVAYDVIDENMFEALARRFPDSPVLPNLRTLWWFTEGHPDFVCHLQLFLAPQLTNLSFYRSDNNPCLAAIQSIQTVCPSLRRLRVNFKLGANDKLPPFFYTRVIGGLPALESFHHPGCLPPATIIHLSRLPNFEIMDFYDHPLAVATALAAAPMPAFAHLTTLCIRAWDGPSAAALLRGLCLERLKTLHIIFHAPQDFHIHSGPLTEYHRSTFEGYLPSWPDDASLAEIFAVLASGSRKGLQTLRLDLKSDRRSSASHFPSLSLRRLPLLKEFSRKNKSRFRAKVTLHDLAHVLSSSYGQKKFLAVEYVSTSPIPSLCIDLQGGYITGIASAVRRS